METSQSGSGQKVLAFYQELPFNIYSSPSQAASSLLDENYIAAQFRDLHQLLLSDERKTVLDVGCGGGWMSINADLVYGKTVLGVDFNPRVVEYTTQVANAVQATRSKFQVYDLFKLDSLNKTFDVVISMGVLHHTGDTRGALESIVRRLNRTPDARLYIGLYHLYGRRPFLKHFEDLRAQGASSEELFAEFCSMYKVSDDPTYLLSWFKDQVEHPLESSHTLKEVSSWLDSLGMTIESTSINGFNPIEDLNQVFELEKDYEVLSHQRNVVEKRYFPGFFTVAAKF